LTDRRHGPLPALLVVLTFVTGLVDAVCFLRLGNVFVANQTGNVVLLGFSLSGAAGLSAPVFLAGLGSFAVGAVFGRLPAGDRGRRLALGASVEAGLAVVTLVDTLLVPTAYAAIVPLGLAMGLQNTMVRRLGVPYLNTTVLTTTLTALLSEPLLGRQTRAGRRLVSVAALFAGAAVGGVLVEFTTIGYTVGLAAVLLAAVAGTAYLLARRGGDWVKDHG
jgi:uncharacterized membrane protein YoaK (UPF0700 family)